MEHQAFVGSVRLAAVRLPTWLARPDLGYLLLAPLGLHVAFSRFGFNPTDDGFILAMGRRLLDGQVPHRDFVSVRPVGSPLLHLPELLAGDLALWTSRGVVWLEWCAIAWAASLLLCHAFEMPRHGWQRTALWAVALAGTVHSFPLMAWHTVDGLLLAILGWTAIRLGGSPRVHAAGWLLAGASVLAKQNFAAVLPVLLVLAPAAARRTWWLCGLPVAAYALAMAGLGAWEPMVAQLLALTGRFEDVAMSPYGWTAERLVAFAVGMAAVGVAAGRWRFRGLFAPLAGSEPVLVLAGLGYGAFRLAMGTLVDATLLQESHLAFAGAAGALTMLAALGRRDQAVLLLAFLALAWVAGISVGYEGPAVGTGLLAASLLAVWLAAPAWSAAGRGWLAAVGRPQVAAALAFAGLLVIACLAARASNLYRESPAWTLTEPAGDVLGGADGILVDRHTRAYLEDFAEARALAAAEGRPYAVVPDLAGWWVGAGQPNPLLIDWPNNIELSDPGIRDQVLRQLDGQRGNLTVIVTKVSTGSLSSGMVPQPPASSHVVAHVQAHYEAIGETRHFVLYR